jgi:hypothetical protein
MAKRVLLSLWIVACVAVLAFAIVKRGYDDIDIAFTYFMLFLTFPAGLAVGLLFGGLSSFVSIPGGITFVAFAWPTFLIVGYFQWFVVLPNIIRWLKARQNVARP